MAISVIGYVKLIRPANSIFTVIAVIIGALTTGTNIFVPSVTYACISAFLIVAGGFVVNDFYDKDIDAANERDRPIPKGLVKPENAKAFGYFLLTVGVIIAILTLNILSVTIAVTGAFLLDQYSRLLKPRFTIWGNLVTSYSTAITYAFGWSSVLIVPHEKVILSLFWMFTISIFASMSREFIKAIHDIRGDSQFNIRTVAVRSGIKNAAVLGIIMMAIAVAFTPIPYLTGVFGISYLALIIVVDVIALTSCALLLRETYKREVPVDYLTKYAGKMKQFMLLAMSIGILAFGVGLFM